MSASGTVDLAVLVDRVAQAFADVKRTGSTEVSIAVRRPSADPTAAEHAQQQQQQQQQQAARLHNIALPAAAMVVSSNTTPAGTPRQLALGDPAGGEGARSILLSGNVSPRATTPVAFGQLPPHQQQPAAVPTFTPRGSLVAVDDDVTHIGRSSTPRAAAARAQQQQQQLQQQMQQQQSQHHHRTPPLRPEELALHDAAHGLCVALSGVDYRAMAQQNARVLETVARMLHAELGLIKKMATSGGLSMVPMYLVARQADRFALLFAEAKSLLGRSGVAVPVLSTTPRYSAAGPAAAFATMPAAAAVGGGGGGGHRRQSGSYFAGSGTDDTLPATTMNDVGIAANFRAFSLSASNKEQQAAGGPGRASAVTVAGSSSTSALPPLEPARGELYDVRLMHPAFAEPVNTAAAAAAREAEDEVAMLRARVALLQKEKRELQSTAERHEATIAALRQRMAREAEAIARAQAAMEQDIRTLAALTGNAAVMAPPPAPGSTSSSFALAAGFAQQQQQLAAAAAPAMTAFHAAAAAPSSRSGRRGSGNVGGAGATSNAGTEGPLTPTSRRQVFIELPDDGDAAAATPRAAAAAAAAAAATSSGGYDSSVASLAAPGSATMGGVAGGISPTNSVGATPTLMATRPAGAMPAAGSRPASSSSRTPVSSRYDKLEALYADVYRGKGMELVWNAIDCVFKCEFDQQQQQQVRPTSSSSSVASRQAPTGGANVPAVVVVSRHQNVSTAPAAAAPSDAQSSAAAASKESDAARQLAAFNAFREQLHRTVLDDLSDFHRFSAAMSRVTPLRSEYVANCLMAKTKPNSGVVRLLSTVLHDRDVTELSLASNYLGDGGLMPLLPLLSRMYRLHTLVLADNGLRSASISALTDAVKRHPSLTAIDLSHNAGLARDAGKLLLQLVSSTPQLRRLDLNGTQVDSALRERIEKRLVANDSEAATGGGGSGFSSPAKVAMS